MEAFPTVQELANANEEQVLRLWQGLGYYSRARNLHAAAKSIVLENHGRFPSSYKGLLQLKGVGPYTAAAIASICFDEAQPVVDGNVYRFAARYFGIANDISQASTRMVFVEQLIKHIPADQPGSFNQAMMEFGATVCTPKPLCKECPFSSECFAFARQEQNVLPVKSKKTAVRERHFNYIVFKHQDRYLLKQRQAKDVWQGLFDFFLIEGSMEETSVLEEVRASLNINNLFIEAISEPVKHLLSHQRIIARFYEITLEEKAVHFATQNGALKPFSVEEVLNLPKPKLIVNYLHSAGIK